MTEKHNEPKTSQNFILKYLSPIEIVGWVMCIVGMIVIVTSKELNPNILPYAWVSAILGAGIIGWGAGRKHKRK